MLYMLNGDNSKVTFTLVAPVLKRDRVSLIKQQTSKGFLQTCQGPTLWVFGGLLVGM